MEDSIKNMLPKREHEYDKWTLDELLGAKFPPNDWIVDKLIHAGDQVVLAGPPKIGKSILGTQLALAVAQGKDFFLHEDYKPLTKPRKVLVFSLEMNAPMVAERLNQIFSKNIQAETHHVSPADIPLHFVFSAHGQSSFDIIDYFPDDQSKAKKAGSSFLSEGGLLLQNIIRIEKPDLIVFDTLIRVHALDENNNVAMSQLLRHLREICSIDERVAADETGESTETERKRKKIAHVLIHHTRKESNYTNNSANRDANAVRGAGAIHAEADLVLTMSEWDRKGTVMISTSARRVSLPDEFFVKQNGLVFAAVTRPVGPRQAKAEKLADALWTTLSEKPAEEGYLTRKEIVGRVAQLGYPDLTEDNFRKTYYRKIAPFVIEQKPAKGGSDKNLRYRLKEGASEAKFHAALKSAKASP
jgi:KaiC/GvpD/RAD55 family RecA-like ATPase